MDSRAWRATVHRIAKDRTCLSDQHFHFHIYLHLTCEIGHYQHVSTGRLKVSTDETSQIWPPSLSSLYKVLFIFLNVLLSCCHAGGRVNSTCPIFSKTDLGAVHADSERSFLFALSIPKALRQIKGLQFPAPHLRYSPNFLRTAIADFESPSTANSPDCKTFLEI